MDSDRSQRSSGGWRGRRRWRLSAACGAALVVLGLPSIAAASTTVTVTGTTDSTSGTCTTTMNVTSCTTLREAIEDVSDTSGGGTIELSPSGGAYTLTEGQIISDANPVTIDGNGSTINLASDALTGSDDSAFLANGPETFQNLTFENLDAAQGSVFESNDGAITLNQVVFSHDSASTEMFGYAGLSLNGVSFVDDSDSSGAIMTDGGTNTFTDVTLTGETGSSFSLRSGSNTLDDVSISGGDPEGTAVVSVYSVSIDGLAISNLTGTADALYLGVGASTVDDLSVTDNQVFRDPVFIEPVNTNGVATVTGQNWTVADNTSSAAGGTPGGGILVGGGSKLALTFATLDGDSDAGDADELYATADSTVDIGDSIVAGSNADGAVQCAADPGSAIVSTGYNLDQAGGCGFHATGDLNGVNPLLGPLASAMIPNLAEPVSLSYAPLEYASPAVGVIPPADCSAMTDELGDVRPQDPNGCAIGAYESPTTAFTLTQSGAPATATAGTSVSYTLTATNASTSTPEHAVITDTLPAGASLTYASVSVAGGSPVVCTGTTTISCPVGALARGKQAVATITATLNTAGVNVDTANVSSEYPDVNDAKDTASASTQVSPAATQPTSISSSSSSTSSTATALVLSRLKLTPVRFASRSKATLAFTASAAASLTATVTRSALGVKSGKSCVAPPKHARATLRTCTRTVTVVRFTVAAKAGANSAALPAKVRDLAPGTYRLKLATTTLAFTVTKSKRVRSVGMR